MAVTIEAGAACEVMNLLAGPLRFVVDGRNAVVMPVGDELDQQADQEQAGGKR